VRPSVRLWPVLALTCVVALSGCAGEGLQSTPSPLTPLATSGSSSRLRALDDPPAPAPAPEPAPAVDPAPPVPAPAPPIITIGIVGSVGSLAFAPNPSQAAVGDLIVWTNNDAFPHRIVLGDGTVVGDVAAGASTAPVALTSAAMTYHCSIHPSMVGSITSAAADPAPPPAYTPPPDYAPPPEYDYGYGY